MNLQVEIVYFTDPYCSWCWATEPMLYRIRETFRDQIRIHYVMGGLVRDMAEFYDALNNIRTPAQVAPHWRMVSERSGQPIDEGLWLELDDPHFSTWPACIAIRAAFLQGETVGERLLRRFRRAALTERRNISRRDVQEMLAREVEGLDLERWRADLENGRAEKAFQEDLEECYRYGVTGFPTLLFRYGGWVAIPGAQRPVLVVGHRSYATYREILRRLAPALQEHPPRDLLTLLTAYGPLTTRELAEIHGQDRETMRMEMERLEREGKVRRIPVPGGEFWQFAGPSAASGLARDSGLPTN